MSERYTDLRQKEVVNLCDGKRLGCICDVIIDCRAGAMRHNFYFQGGQGYYRPLE